MVKTDKIRSHIKAINYLKYYNKQHYIPILFIARKLTTSPIAKSTTLCRTASSISLINNSNSPNASSNTINNVSSSPPSTPRGSSLAVPQPAQLRRSVSSSSLTKIAALNRMQMLQQQKQQQLLQQQQEQQQQRRNMFSKNRTVSSSSLLSGHSSGGIFNSSLSATQSSISEERLDTNQSFNPSNNNTIMRT